MVVDYILDECHAHPHLCCEYLILLSQVLAGHKGCGHSEATPIPQGEMFAMIEGVFNQLLSANTWSHDSASQQQARSLNSDLLTFLFINLIHTCVHVLEANFDPLLQQLLYPLMQRLGDDNMGVVDAAMATLEGVCLHCGYK